MLAHLFGPWLTLLFNCATRVEDSSFYTDLIPDYWFIVIHVVVFFVVIVHGIAAFVVSPVFNRATN